MIISFFCLSCKRVDEAKILTTCDEKSINNFLWFQEIKNGKTECTIYKGATLYMFFPDDSTSAAKETLFLLENPAASLGTCLSVLYNCSGKVKSLLGEDRTKFLEAHTNGKIIWQKD